MPPVRVRVLIIDGDADAVMLMTANKERMPAEAPRTPEQRDRSAAARRTSRRPDGSWRCPRSSFRAHCANLCTLAVPLR